MYNIIKYRRVTVKNKGDLTMDFFTMASSQCGSHTYPKIDQRKIDLIKKALIDSGKVITGNNPWKIDVKMHGVVLDAVWNEEKNVLILSVASKNWYVPCSKIWQQVDPLINGINSIHHDEINRLLG